MKSFEHTESEVFAELYGFALVDPVGLDQVHGGTPRGNLLELYSTTEYGDRVCEAGAVVPVIGVTGEYYTVLLRYPEGQPLIPQPRRVSDGWVLYAQSSEIVLCGLGYLTDWKPGHEKHRHIGVPQGWYRVSIRGGFANNDPKRLAIEFVLTPSEVKPTLTASLQKNFNFFIEEEEEEDDDDDDEE